MLYIVKAVANATEQTTSSLTFTLIKYINTKVIATITAKIKNFEKSRNKEAKNKPKAYDKPT
mgnify:CR=1 FL=1